MQQIQLNIILFKPVVDNKTFAFYGEKQKGFAPIYWDKLFESFSEGLLAKGKISRLVIQALKEIGSGKLKKDEKGGDIGIIA